MLPLTKELGVNATFALSTSFSLTYALGFLFWGPISDRYGRKRIMVIAIGGLTLTTFLCATASSVWTMTVLRGLQGLAAAGFAPVALAYLTEATAPNRRAGAIGSMSTSFLVAGIFGQVLASTVALQLGWPWFFVLCGVVLAGNFILIFTLVAEVPRTSGTLASLTQQFHNLLRLFVMPTMGLLSLAHIMLLLSFVALYTGIGQHLNSLNVPATDIILIRLAALPAMFISLSVGTFARILSVARVAQLGFTIAAVGMLGTSLFTETLSAIIISSIIYVAGVALAIPTMINLYGETAAPNRGSGMAINGFILFIGASIGPILAGMITNLRTLAIILFTLLILAALTIFIFSMRTHKAVTHD